MKNLLKLITVALSVIAIQSTIASEADEASARAFTFISKASGTTVVLKISSIQYLLKKGEVILLKLEGGGTITFAPDSEIPELRGLNAADVAYRVISNEMHGYDSPSKLDLGGATSEITSKTLPASVKAMAARTLIRGDGILECSLLEVD